MATSLVEPGRAVGAVLLLLPCHEVESLIGKPEKTSRYDTSDDREERVAWLSYYQLGLDLCINNENGLLTGISLFRGGIGRHKSFEGATRNGLTLGSQRTEVTKSLGEPNEVGDSHTYLSGKVSRPWISYDIGIGFEFSLQDQRVDRISIFLPKHKDGALK